MRLQDGMKCELGFSIHDNGQASQKWYLCDRLCLSVT